MPGIFGIYGLSSRALMAFQNAMTTVGHNISNAGTVGYHRQRVDLRPSLPEFSAWGALGTGVRVDSVQRIEDRFIELAIQREAPVLSRFDAQTGALKQAELVFGEPSDSGITSVLDEFFTGWDDLASNPEDLGAREAVVRQGMSLADAVGASRERLATQQHAITGEVSHMINEANRLISEMQNLNRAIVSAQRGGQIPADLEDRRDMLVAQLGDLVGASASVEADGTAIVRLGGRTIVQLESATPIEFDPAAGTRPSVGGRALQGSELDGRVGGLLDVRDDDLAEMIHRLDEFAVDLAARVNELHAAGTDANGDDTVPFFVLVGMGQDPVDRAGAGLRVNPLLVADSSRVAAGGNGAPGDNTVALDIAALRSDSSGPAGALRALVVDSGTRARHSEDLAEGQRIVVDSFRAQRESISGVSLDEEGANLLRFQRSYQAAAQLISTADEMLQTLLTL